MPEDSGKISFKEDQVVYVSEVQGSWSFPVSSLRVVGECTTHNGPCIMIGF